MVREISKSDYTEDELENLKQSKCWCGKPKKEFDKNQRIYCSKQHQQDWYSRTITWSVFKEEVLHEKGRKCSDCGAVKDDEKENYSNVLTEWREKIKNLPNFKELLNEVRIKKLKDIEEDYQQAMDDAYIIDHDIYYLQRKGIPEKPNKYDLEVRFEVDHIKAVSLGGEMWDKKNLQVLCVDCHKTKTKLDMKKLRSKNGKK